MATILLAATIASYATVEVRATENGGNNYPVGVNTVTPAILPVPGQVVWQSYNLFYDAAALDNAAGRSSVPGYRVQVAVSAERFLYTWNVHLWKLGLTSGVVQPFAYTDLQVGRRSDDRLQVGDMTLQPLYLSYHSPSNTFVIFGGVDIFIPTGAYSTHRLTNTGRNVFAFLPNVDMTWFATPHLEISATLSTEIHTENPDTNYRSGSFFNADYGINYRFIPRHLPPVFVGLGGYALQQYSNDTLNDRTYQHGYRGRVVSIGPQVGALIHGVGIALKYQHEFAVENRPYGQRVWFQFKLPFG